MDSGPSGPEWRRRTPKSILPSEQARGGKSGSELPHPRRSHSTRSKSGLCGAGSPRARSTRNFENLVNQ
jgi:hypothetical protein